MELRKLRKENKYTQEQIAKYLNMSQSAYQHYENERAEPSIETLCKLADFYKVPLDYLVGREFNDEIGYLTEEQKKVVFVLKQLDDEGISKLLSLAVRILNDRKDY